MRLKETSPVVYAKLPTLHVVHSPDHIKFTVPPEIVDKVVVISEVLKTDDYDELLKDCGLCVCVTAAEGFGHAVVEAMSVGCNLLLSPISPFTENIVGPVQCGVYYGETKEIVQQPECIGFLMETSVSSIMDALIVYTTTPFQTKRDNSEFVRGLYEANHKRWIETMKQIIAESFDTSLPAYTLKDVFPKEEDLPDVSVLTITRDRRVFMPLAKYS